MKLATRLNSVLRTVDKDILKGLEIIAGIDGINAVDLNYPEHFENVDIKILKNKLKELNLEVNGVALRFRDKFINGDLGNLDSTIHQEAMKLSKNASDACEFLGGKIITVWLGHDGFDYPFQLDYGKVWEQVANSIRELADYKPNLNYSIEYKPFEERAYALIDSIGSTLYMVKEIDRSNVGVTLDYCHMLMKRENPAFGLALAIREELVYGVHLNDGYGFQDNGLMIGSSTLFQTFEFLYYYRKHYPETTIYFDTFPIRENPVEEIKQNIKVFRKLIDKIDKIGINTIDAVIAENRGTQAHDLLFKLLDL